MNDLLLRLEEHLQDLKSTNDKLGFTFRVESIRNLISTFGWEAVNNFYHPDNNIDDKARFEMYKLVKFIHEYDLKTN